MRIGSEQKLTEEEIQDRLARYSKDPKPAIRDEIVMQYANLVESVGRRFMGACEPLEDLVQEGYIGLINSVDKYDAEKGVKFSTYATHFIIGQIKHYLRDKGKIIKEPAWLQELNQRMTKVIESLNQEHGRQPTEKEVAESMQMPERTVRDLLTTREVFKVSSLDGDRENSSGTKEAENIAEDKLVTFQLPLEDKIVLETALDRLKDIEQCVISDHYYKGLNQTEIAGKFNISCNYVSHILRNGTKKLRKILSTEEILDDQIQRTHATSRAKVGENPLDSMSVMDATTNLYSRKYFVDRLDEEISRAFRYNEEVGVILLKIELPEEVDSLVRLIRLDDLLYNIGQSIRSSVRKMDMVARYDECVFALILPHTGKNVSVVADRLDQIISNIEIETGRKNIKVKISAKMAPAFYPANADSCRSLLCFAQDMLDNETCSYEDEQKLAA